MIIQFEQHVLFLCAYRKYTIASTEKNPCVSLIVQIILAIKNKQNQTKYKRTMLSSPAIITIESFTHNTNQLKKCLFLN